jgi:hypothetical protein
MEVDGEEATGASRRMLFSAVRRLWSWYVASSYNTSFAVFRKRESKP